MKKLKAFTLIETLIVIIVFCIGILVVLQGLSQTLRNKEYADIQIKSAFLAREGIEMMFNLRDANYHKELPWNCIFNYEPSPGQIKLDDNDQEINNPFCKKGYFGTGNVKILKIGMGTGNEYIHVETGDLTNDFDENFSKYPIYFHSGNIVGGTTGYLYDHVGTEDEKTRFARYLVITGVVDENGKAVNTDKIIKIESHVLYKKGHLTGEKVMETFMGNYEFNQ